MLTNVKLLEDSELGLACCVLNWPELTMPVIAGLGLRQTDFIDPLLGTIVAAAIDAHAEGVVPDVIVTGKRVLADGRFNMDSFRDVMGVVLEYQPYHHHAREFAEDILRAAVDREIQATVSQRIGVATADEIEAAIVQAKQRLNLITNTDAETNEHLVSSLPELWIRNRLQSKSGGIPTALAALDEHIGGPITPGSYCIIGGLSKNGKTLFMLQTLIAAAKAGHVTVFFSQEMGPDAIGERVASMASDLNLRDFDASMADAILEDVRNMFATANHLIFRQVAPNPQAVADAMVHYADKEGATVFGIDYVQMILPTKGDDLRHKITESTLLLKETTTRLGVTTFVASQLSRAAADGSPRQHHLRESSQLGDDGDVIFLLSHPFRQRDEHEVQAYIDEHGLNADPRELYVIRCEKLKNREAVGLFHCAIRTRPFRIVPLESQPDFEAIEY